MDAGLQSILLVLLGAVLGGAAVLAWRISELQQVRAESEPPPTSALPEGLAGVLSVLRSSALVVDADDTVRKATAPAYAMGILAGDQLSDEQLRDAVRAVRRDGQIRELELASARRPNSPARTLAVRIAPLGTRLVLVLIEDRTRERRVEAIRRDFVANVSHELKTPVGAIQLLSEAVQEAADDPEAVQRFAGRMGSESRRLSRLVQQIIELSRLQGDDPLEVLAGIEVDRVVERVMEENAFDAERKQIEITRDGEDGLMLLGEEEQVALALGNLVANAVSYSPERSTVLITTTGTAETVEIAVTDQGIGIPAGEIERIFERFYRVDPARHRSTGGTGLGLSIVKHVVASHGGEVKVWSAEGQGSTFTLSLPRRRPTGVPEGGDIDDIDDGETGDDATGDDRAGDDTTGDDRTVVGRVELEAEDAPVLTPSRGRQEGRP